MQLHQAVLTPHTSRAEASASSSSHQKPPAGYPMTPKLILQVNRRFAVDREFVDIIPLALSPFLSSFLPAFPSRPLASRMSPSAQQNTPPPNTPLTNPTSPSSSLPSPGVYSTLPPHTSHLRALLCTFPSSQNHFPCPPVALLSPLPTSPPIPDL